MPDKKQEQIGLRTKILFLVGTVTAALLITAFIIFTFKGKNLIIKHLERSSVSVTRAFSVFVLDSLIKDENGFHQAEDVLGHYMLNFMEQNPKIRSITVYGPNTEMIAGTSLDRSTDPPIGLVKSQNDKKYTTHIYHEEDKSWVITVLFPMKTGTKNWGTLIVRFNADREQREVTKLFWIMLILTVFLVISVLAIMTLFLNRITHSLGFLKIEMDRFDLESKDFLTPIESQDEIGMLFSHFNELKKRLAQSKQDLIKAQKQIYRAEKLASIGRFASGMAHEINNPLNGIRSCLYAIRKEPENLTQTEEYLDLATEGLSHIEMVVRKLLGFARQQAPSKGTVDIEKELNTVIGLLDYKLDQHRIDLTIHTDKHLPTISGDAHLIQELLMNLILNSYDAINERTIKEASSYKGTLDISMQEEDNRVKVIIEDNGTGISSEALEHIFDPFFTTKDQGKGTGLGLSVALGITQAHGGKIECDSRLNQYCRFTITLPMEDPNENPVG